jgi:ferredoxin
LYLNLINYKFKFYNSNFRRIKMALVITDDCISCQACETECPNNAIYAAGDDWSMGGNTYPAISNDHTYIATEKCTECVGFYDEPQCQSVCPTGAIIKDENNVETSEQLMAKKEKLDQVGR